MTTTAKSQGLRILFSVAVLLILVCCIYKTFYSNNRKVAFVDINRFASSYQLKKDLEQASSGNLSRIKFVVDSLRMIQETALRQGERSPVDTPLAYANAAFERYYVQSNQEISRQVWERANPVLMDYGKENDLQLLIGANGQGTVLYGAPEADVTEEVIRYANQHYAGKK